MTIINFITNPKDIKECLEECFNEFFNPDTLIINDTRLLISKEVLPHIPFVGGYDQRILPILANTTAIFAQPFSKITHDYYKKLNLAQNVEVISIPNIPEISLTENILGNPELIEKLKARGFKKLINFSIDAKVEKLARTIGAETSVSSEISEYANNKLKLKQFLEKSTLPTVQGIYTNKEDVIREYFEKEEHYFFKDPLGVSGYGFWSNKKNNIQDILLGYEGKDIIIEQVIEKESSPSIQFCIYGDKKAVIFGFTDQILEGGQHYIGNESPSVYYHQNDIHKEFIRQSEIIISYLINLGYIGFGGIDFMVSLDKKIYATEVNARFTGATYPAITSFLLTGRIDTTWRYLTKEGVTESIKDYLGISISKRDEYGIFPLCIAPLELHGRVQVLSLGNLDEHDL